MRLTVLHDDNGVFKDYSAQAENFLIKDFDLDLHQSEDYLYIGLYKPFERFFSLFSTVNANAGAFTAQYFDIDSASWETLEDFEDETLSFTENGFLKWKRAQENWGETEINSISKFWIRLRPTVTHSVTTVQGMALIFSTDADLSEEVPNITKHLPKGQTTFYNFHQAAKRHIIQKLRNQGHTILDSEVHVKLLNEWDILDPEELAEASRYYVLSKIYFHASDRPDDKYRQISMDWMSDFTEAFKTYRLTLDVDDDGIADPEEKNYRTHGRLFR